MADQDKYVYGFSEDTREMKDLLDGKGSGMADMSNLGLPVPPGFTITTEAGRAYMRAGEILESLMESVTEYLGELEETTEKRLGDSGDPLLVSVRSGAATSMPGMMDTVLNLGLNATIHEVGLDYVSCSPYRVPIARLAAGHTAILEDENEN